MCGTPNDFGKNKISLKRLRPITSGLATSSSNSSFEDELFNRPQPPAANISDVDVNRTHENPVMNLSLHHSSNCSISNAVASSPIISSFSTVIFQNSTLLIRGQLPATGVAVEGDDPQFNVSSSMTSSSIASTPSTPLLMSSYSRGSLTYTPEFSTSSSSNIYGDQQPPAAQDNSSQDDNDNDEFFNFMSEVGQQNQHWDHVPEGDLLPSISTPFVSVDHLEE